MKKLILFILLIPALCMAGEIATFRNHGELRINLTAVPTNQADKDATYILATGAIPDDGTIVGDLYDAEDNLIATKRVYSYSGTHKNIPASDLTAGQQGYLSGSEPDDKWDVPVIKTWLTDRQKKDELGAMVKGDPYEFTALDTKAALLLKVAPVDVKPIEIVKELPTK